MASVDVTSLRIVERGPHTVLLHATEHVPRVVEIIRCEGQSVQVLVW